MKGDRQMDEQRQWKEGCGGAVIELLVKGSAAPRQKKNPNWGWGGLDKTFGEHGGYKALDW